MTRLRYALEGTVYSVDVDGSGDLGRDVTELDHGDTSNYENRPPEGKLPSMGQERETCGDPHVAFCSECGSTHRVGQSCGRSLCPRDWAKWAVERSTTVVAKMEERRKELARRRGGNSPKFHHVVLSFEGIEFAREDAESAMFELCKYLLSSALAVDGGLLAYHPYRGRDGDDRGAWKGRIGRESDWGEVRSELKHSEHVHALVVADSVDYLACEAVCDRTGIPVHRIEKDDSQDNHVSLYGLSDLARAATYSLSHTAVVKTEDGGSRSLTRWFGGVAQTAADERTEARANARVRDIAGTTLGVSFSELSCDRALDENESPAPERASGYGGGESGEAGSESVEIETCGGRLLDITQAPRFLENPEWVAEAPNADQLRQAWEEWRRDHDPPP